MLPKYLIADVDDTLTVGGSLPPSVLSAIKRADQAGIEIILNTGRPAGYGAALLSYLDGVSAVVVENGGAWLDRRDFGSETPVQFRVPPPPDLRQRLHRLCEQVGTRARVILTPTADNAYRLTDHTVVRRLPAGAEPGAFLAELAAHVDAESDGAGSLLVSSIHIHFMLDRSGGERRDQDRGGAAVRSKADGVARLLRSRGLADPDAELRTAAIAVGDSANDASLFDPGRFALSVGVRNIERHFPEFSKLGLQKPKHITAAPEGFGLIELIDDILSGRLP
jgi:hydroxymethylpyrimidine pyrophosphatase-like HAD family hydrolase